MDKSIMKISVVVALLAIICAGCTSTDGGAVVGGILQGVGAGLSGL